MNTQLSDDQLAANKKNAKLGGVKTEEGKRLIRFNARKHGILAILMTAYEQNLFGQFLEQLYEELAPANFMEEMLVERMAVCYLRLFRSGKAENEFMKNRLNPNKEYMSDMLVLDKKGYEPILKSDDIEKLQNTFMRYETSIENRLYRAMNAIERLQRLRKGELISAPVTIDVNNHADDGFVSQNN